MPGGPPRETWPVADGDDGFCREDLEPYDIARLQSVSRHLQVLCLDNELWKRHCFEDSAWYMNMQRRRFARIAAASTLNNDGSTDGDTGYCPELTGELSGCQDSQSRLSQDMANWDPTFPGERISWYDEYVQRNGPASVNWFEIPRHREGGDDAIVEARGLALYSPDGREEKRGTMLAVAPLDDGSVCLWDVRGTRGKRGGIVAKSAPDILFIDGPGSQNSRRSKRVDTGVTDCVSVDSLNHKAYFAVQSRKCCA
jgi:hypothetical protein